MPSPSTIDLRHLRYFLAVYEELHFGHAAERLHIAQPPLSQAIRKLENELGVTLLERTSRAVKPTLAGEALAEEARKVLASFNFAVSEARRAGSRDAPLRIGCAGMLPTIRLQRFVRELKKRDASLRTEVIRLWAVDQIERLRGGLLDLGVFMRVDEHPDLEYEPLFRGEPVHVFLPNGHALADKSVVTPGDLAGEMRISFPRTINPEYQDRFAGLLESAGYRFAGRHEISSKDPRDALLAVAGGLGVVFGAPSLRDLGDEGEDLIMRPLDPPLELPETVVAWRASAPRALRSWLTAVRDVARTVCAET
ncbi:MAG TPA: LysR substrate-binding domain-containing protein [Gaiellaceae bacterium]|nr:LysR substrate-binding domain-containing protein [Gaiellaceae bacterium]